MRAGLSTEDLGRKHGTRKATLYERQVFKVLKALAEYHDMSLGDLLEGIVLHAFDGKTPFSPESLKRIHDLKRFYALDLDSSASHRLTEIKHGPAPKKATSGKRK